MRLIARGRYFQSTSPIEAHPFSYFYVPLNSLSPAYLVEASVWRPGSLGGGAGLNNNEGEAAHHKALTWRLGSSSVGLWCGGGCSPSP
jgi:hypothetical protein